MNFLYIFQGKKTVNNFFVKIMRDKKYPTLGICAGNSRKHLEYSWTKNPWFLLAQLHVTYQERYGNMQCTVCDVKNLIECSKYKRYKELNISYIPQRVKCFAY